MPTCVALIPARSGSKRVVGKNVRKLNGHPLLAYSIGAAKASGVFKDVIVSTDDNTYAEIARSYGAWVPGLRPREYATDTSPDIEWVRHTLETFRESKVEWDCFAILRPTSPFRTADTIRRAWARWCEKGERFDSMRAVEKCQQHPWKMWTYEQACSSSLVPLMSDQEDYYLPPAPGHSMQYAALPSVYVQNASLEIAWTKTVFERGSISGDYVLPFFTEGHEGMDVNRPQDWDAVELILSKHATIPAQERKPLLPDVEVIHDPWEAYRNSRGEICHLEKGWQH